MSDRPSLTREAILAALTRVGEIADARGHVLELNVYGGAALALAFDPRTSTLDVDAVSTHSAAEFRQIAAQVAEEFGWPDDWANDAVKGFVSPAGGMRDLLTLPGLTVRIQRSTISSP